ncbi:DUF6517 family protein [Methermicoccus shengliensis]|uniref:Lipoprotein n=1 Tax=Methermicoccus shengliensis TaxID=660064 RepID=A0A832RWL7_9EURY|nr:DUF6517 family protein [Methermicoccus shengliensis]KUK05254.1 MAG: hypothetical protein XD46_0247 [Euryarchaeota archaeon 55_53]KUK30331.1 MAG: hypothetical protein XD62_0594 [Methanosarcinales archeaon 56_1174]MDI3487841.1 hypothetical protein [Methanosarcinales archaeon]MDN5294512.1 hypothetical protein [Methanosarcinales archaeon]HIH69759.1 hypothetical protein [Methermicoccus shengliensis]
MNARILVLLVVIMGLAVAGCTQAKQAWPATIPEDALSSAGWAQQGNVSYQGRDIDVAGITVGINMALLSYVDTTLLQRLLEDAQHNASVLIDSEFSALPTSTREQLKTRVRSTIQGAIPTGGAAGITTVRVVLPMGVSAPSSVMERLIDGVVQSFSGEIAGLRNLRKVSEETFTTESGRQAMMSIYEGTIERGEMSINFKILAAHWSDEGSSVVAVGYYPYGDVKVPIELSTGGITKKRTLTAASIDDNEMKEKVLSLMKKIR